jgi:hypothetical protein
MMMRVVVTHRGYGCDTGCCGHAVEMGDNEEFVFDHPDSNSDVDKIAFAQRAVIEAYGAEHVADLDWMNSWIVYD